MTLQDRLDAFRTDFETNIAPAQVVTTLHRAIDELVAAGQARHARKAGDIAPSFALPDTTGQIVSSDNLLTKGPLIVSFYRGIWCPFCNLELQALETALPDIRKRGASLVAISQQTPVNSRKSQRENKLSFPILTDKGGEIGNAFGLRWTAPDYLRDLHKTLGADLTMFNGEDSWTLPMPSRYIIGQDGVIAYAEVNPDYTIRPDPMEMLPTLDRLSQVQHA